MASATWSWTRSLDQEHVATIDFRPGKCQCTYRLVMLRKRIKVSAGQLLLAD